MRNHITSRSSLGAMSLSVPAGTKAGDPVRVGALNGVAVTNVSEGGNPPGSASVQIKGEFDFTVTGIVAKVGDPVFIKDGALNVTNTNPLFGHALETKPLAAASVIAVRLANI